MRTLRFVAYLRVSDTNGRDTDTATSAPDQRRAIREYAKSANAMKRGARIEIVEWIEDFDQSGGKWERPGFQRALAMIENHEVDGFICAKLDRFSRSLYDALRAMKMIDQADAKFISVADGFDTTTATGRAMLQITLVFAELERARITENWKLQRDDALDGGVALSKPPLGYRKGAHGRFEKDPKVAPLIAHVFAARASGASWAELADYLEGHGLGVFQRQTIANMLKRRTYLGEITDGHRVIAKAHEPIVTREVWEAAQSNVTPIRRGKTETLLAGIVRCASCGYILTRTTSRNGRPEYKCRGRHKQGRCPEPVGIGVARLDAYLDDVFRAKLGATPKSIRAEMERLTAEIADTVAEIERAEQELALYRDSAPIAVIGKDAYLAGLAARQEPIDAARAHLADLQRRNVGMIGADVAAVYENSTIAEQRTILGGAVDAVFIRRAHSTRDPISARVLIAWRGEAPADLPSRSGGTMQRIVFDDEPDAVAGMASA